MSLLLFFAGVSARVTQAVRDLSDGKRRRGKTKWLNGDDELSEAELQLMRAKLAKLKARKKKRHVEPEPVPVPVIQPEPWKEYVIDYEALARDAKAYEELKASAAEQLARIVEAASTEQKRMQDEDDAEALLLLSI